MKVSCQSNCLQQDISKRVIIEQVINNWAAMANLEAAKLVYIRKY